MNSSCVKCLHNTDHPFGISYINDLCSGCYTHQEKFTIDWESKHNYVLLLAEKIKAARSSSSIYDCIIPVKGVAEDYFVVEKVLSLELNPLLVGVNDYFFNDIGWHNLHNLMTVFDLDSQIYTPNLIDYKELVSTSFRKHLHILYPSLSLNASYPVHVAIERNIPLIIWGQLQPIEQVGKFSHHDQVEMTKWSQIEHCRIGYNIDQLIGNGAQLNPQNLIYYEYPKQAIRLGRKSPIGIYLSNFYRWDPLKQNNSILKYGFKPQFEISTFDPYERAGSSVYYTAHELSRILRHGYRKVRDHLNREIRHNRIDKKSALILYEHYRLQKVNPNPFLSWLGVTDSGKQWIVQHLLGQCSDLLSDQPTIHDKPVTLPKSISNLLAPSFRPENSFVTFGKGI